MNYREPFNGCSTIHELVTLHARATPDAVAVVTGTDRLTYGELDAWSDRMAGRLAAAGVSLETRVAVTVPRSVDFVVAALAVLKAGGCYVPVDPAYPRERRALLLADSGAELVITADGSAEVDLPTLSPDRSEAGPGRPDTPVGGENLAYVIYTSGSTGKPKGVQITHENVLSLLRDDERLAVAPGTTVAHLAPTAFDAATFEVWAALANGARVVVLADAHGSVEELGGQLRRHRPDWLFLTTGLFNLLVEHDPAAVESVGTLLAGGDVMSPQHVRVAAKHVRHRAYAAYGPTETTVFATLHAVDQDATLDRVPLGTTLRGRTVHVLGDDARPVPDGAVGEIFLGGAGLARGYHDRPALTAARFVPDPWAARSGARLYRTGDRGRMLPDGEVEFHGRIDRQVKVRGFRIEPGEVEAVLNAHESVAAAAVTVVPDPDGTDKRLVAYVGAAGSAELSPAGLREWLSDRLPAYLVPTNYVLLERLPLDPNGKLDRAALPPPWRTRAELGHLDLPPYLAPTTAAEERIAEAFVDALALDRVGLHDNFFQLGGDSLRTVRVLAGLRGHGVSVSSREFFANPTVAELAALVRQPRGTSQGGHAPC